MTLDQTPDGDHGPEVAFPLHVARFQDRLDRLLFGRLDEATSVHDHDLGAFDVGGDPSSVTDELGHHPLGIDRILVAAERHECDARAVGVPNRVDLVPHGSDVRGDVRPNRLRRDREDGQVSDPRHQRERPLIR